MADLTSIANALNIVFARSPVMLTYLNEEVMDPVLWPHKPSRGGDSWDWIAVSTDNASGGETADGAGFPASASLVYQRASLPYSLWDSAAELTDGVKQAAMGEADIIGALRLELRRAMARLRDNIAATFLGTGATGIQNAIDSTGTYATIAKGSITNWASRETAIGGPHTIAMLQNDEEALLLPDRRRGMGTRPNALYLSEEQATNHFQLVGTQASTALVRWDLQPDQADRANAGQDRSRRRFGDANIYPIPDLTNSITLFGWQNEGDDTTGIFVVEHSGQDDRQGGLKVEAVARGGYTTKVVSSWGGQLVVPDPFRWAKNTGVTV